MEFKQADQVTDVCWQMRYSDYYRGRNRALINQLFNGAPPYTEEEVQENGIAINVNSLEGTRLGHDARSQFNNAFLKPGFYFQASTDMGPVHKRSDYNQIVTRELNRIMKRSLSYFECMRGKFALLVLHGIGPASWENQDCWCPEAKGIEDLLIPGNINLDFKGLPFFAFLKSFTAPELIRVMRKRNPDPGWNMDLMKSAIRFIDTESMALVGTNFPEIWSPEKVEERVKSDGTFYAGDDVPTLDCFDFYYWSDQGKNSGWRRRIVVDDWSNTLTGGKPDSKHNPKMDFARGQFLYSSDRRKVASDRSELFSCQFADLSAVAPFRYHSVRSLGFLMYAICNIQNRMRCKFQESVFEALTMLFRVKSPDDVQRALKLELLNKGFIDDTINPVPASERWQVNANLVELGLNENRSLISENSSSYVQNQNFSRDKTEKTRYQVMAEVNAVASLVSAGLNQAYQYQNFEYMEIMRRFLKSHSTDADVQRFRAAVLRQGVPEKILVPEAWNTEPEQIFGGGNLTRESAIAEWLMQHYDKYEPTAQRTILRKATFSVTGDPAFSGDIVPEKEQISSSVHDAELAFAALMAGNPVRPSPGLNPEETASTVIQLMVLRAQKIMQSGNVGTPQDVQGFQMAAQYAGQFIQQLAQDKEQAQEVKQLGDALGKVMNMVKAFAQRQAEMMKKAQQSQQHAAAGNGGLDPKDAAKIQGTIIMAKTKAQLASESHAQRTAQRQIQFEQRLKQQQQQHITEIARGDLETAATIRRDRFQNLEE